MHAASFEDRVAQLFRTPLGERMALSPDGQRIAYTTQPPGGELAIVMMALEPPGPKRTIKIDPDRDSSGSTSHPPTQLRFMRWATPNRLIYAPAERILPSPSAEADNGRGVPNLDGPHIVAPILAVDADGRQRGTLTDTREFLETSAEARTLADLLRTAKELAASRVEPVRSRLPHLDILGFLPADREQLVIATHGGYKLPAQYLLDTRLGSVRSFGGNWPNPPADTQVFDWYRLRIVGEHKEGTHPTTAWRDDEFAAIQRELEAKFSRRVVEILDWSETRARVLFRVTGGSDPGRIFVYQRPENLVLEVLRRAPWLNAAKLNDTRFFECAAADGARLSGYVTWPKHARLTPPPLLVRFPSGFPGHAQLPFDPEAEVFADLGYVVARLNHRCVGGIRPEDLTAVRATIDRLSVDDVRTVIDAISARMPDRPFDARRIATLGRGFGGYLALRALQLHPTVFRCGIAIDAPLDLEPFAQGSNAGAATSATTAREIPSALIQHREADWKRLSVLAEVETLTHPVLLLVEPGRRPPVDAAVAEVRARLQGLGRAPEYHELDPGFAAALPAPRAAVYRKIEEFLNLRLNNFAVKIGPTKEVE